MQVARAFFEDATEEVGGDEDGEGGEEEESLLLGHVN